ncbi:MULTISPECIES: DUF2642 domain-containing protein [Bacillus]|uniref:DUF2642 domain-containing protein n=1 Tax=Bacillus TaxID=1386 RepID=UPI000BF8FCF6|nr:MULTISPECIES: DUF2642 domain-containing protein [Bacillus]PFA58944.1 DUF2642 domain-containing protein [Bacillus sp. AFS015896]PGL81963.1 DUF2642 domain-containing protein [Bacillus sp. AFS054943]PGZ72251.1 DUF2642 domain-containing protein [Bacillus sp. AFS029637]
MCLFRKYWHKLSRLFNRQLNYFLDDKLMPAVERLLFSQNFARFIQRNSKQATEEFIESSQFQAIICNILKECSASPFKEIAQQYLNKNVEITVTVGQLTGVIVAVGDDFLTLQEGIRTKVLLPFTSIISIKEV